MSTVRLLVEIAGWCVVVPIVLLLAYVAVMSLAENVARRYTTFPRFWRLGLYVKRSNNLPDAVTLNDNSEWVQLWDRWYWKKGKEHT